MNELEIYEEVSKYLDFIIKHDLSKKEIIVYNIFLKVPDRELDFSFITSALNISASNVRRAIKSLLSKRLIANHRNGRYGERLYCLNTKDNREVASKIFNSL